MDSEGAAPAPTVCQGEFLVGSLSTAENNAGRQAAKPVSDAGDRHHRGASWVLADGSHELESDKTFWFYAESMFVLFNKQAVIDTFGICVS